MSFSHACDLNCYGVLALVLGLLWASCSVGSLGISVLLLFFSPQLIIARRLVTLLVLSQWVSLFPVSFITFAADTRLYSPYSPLIHVILLSHVLSSPLSIWLPSCSGWLGILTSSGDRYSLTYHISITYMHHHNHSDLQKQMLLFCVVFICLQQWSICSWFLWWHLPVVYFCDKLW